MNGVTVFFILLLVLPVVWAVRNSVRYRKVSAVAKVANMAMLVNSAVLYALAFNVVFFLQELLLVLGKRAIGLCAVLYHNNHTYQGEHPEALLMQGVGALGIFLFGVVCLLVFVRLKRSRGGWALLLLWLGFHGVVQSLPQVTVAYLDANTDVGQALVGYLQLPDGLMQGVAILAVIAQAFFCTFIGRWLLGFAPETADLSNPATRLRFNRYLALGGGLLGTLLIAPFRVMPLSQVLAPVMVFAFAVPWVWVAASLQWPIQLRSGQLVRQVPWLPMVVLLVLWAFFQGILASGLAFCW